VIDLPCDLGPWSALLDLFPPELTAGLGAWLPEIARLIGPIRTSQPTLRGEPDGFAGIARRGSYERLLLTEWLLAEEAPLEFLRRASSGELSFFAIAQRSPSRSRGSVVLFDAGPAQLGSPRLVHLAALIVLARRAEAEGARFAWGMLQDPASALAMAVTRESVLALLGAHSALPASAEDIEAWAARAAQSSWEDLWIIGAASTIALLGNEPIAARDPAPRAALVEGRAPLPWRPALLEVQDLLEPGRRAVKIVARAPSAPPRELELGLPSPRACARLLRDPFAAAAPMPRPSPRGVAPTSNLLFAPNASKLFARGTGGEILAYPVPNSPRAQTGRPKRYRPTTNGVVAAVGWAARGVVMLTVTDRELVLEHTNQQGPPGLRASLPRPLDLPLAASSLDDPLRHLLFRPYGPRLVTVALDAAGTLFELSNDFDPPVSRIATSVTALAPVRQRIAFVGCGVTQEAFSTPPGERPRGIRTIPPSALPTLDSGFHLVKLGGDRVSGSVEALDGDGTFQACFGFAEGEAAERGLIAVQQHGELWTIHGSESRRAFVAPKGTQVVGVWQASGESDPKLLVIDEDRRSLSLLGHHTSHRLPRASAEIAHVTMSTYRPIVASATTQGEVVILSLPHDARLAQFVPETG
jgi:hypothetical protein